MLNLVLLVFAFVLAVVEAFRAGWAPGAWPIPHLGWLALALYLLTLILGGAGVR